MCPNFSIAYEKLSIHLEIVLRCYAQRLHCGPYILYFLYCCFFSLLIERFSAVKLSYRVCHTRTLIICKHTDQIQSVLIKCLPFFNHFTHTLPPLSTQSVTFVQQYVKTFIDKNERIVEENIRTLFISVTPLKLKLRLHISTLLLFHEQIKSIQMYYIIFICVFMCVWFIQSFPLLK